MFVKLENEKFVPVSQKEMKEQHPNTSFSKRPPENAEFIKEWSGMMAGFGYYWVELQPNPEIDFSIQAYGDLQYSTLENGLISAVRSVVDKGDEAIAEAARQKRSGLLLQSDWIVTKSVESGEPVPAEWLEYRQALRDITEQDGFPKSIIWPAKPE